MSTSQSTTTNQTPAPIREKTKMGRNSEAMLNRKIKWGVPCSVYLSQRYREEFAPLVEAKLGVSASFRLNELMLRDLAEMQGQVLPTEQSIQVLEDELAQLIAQVNKFTTVLTKVGCYTRLEDIAIDKFGLNYETYGNVDSVVKQFLNYTFLKTDHFGKDDVELFVQLLGFLRKKSLKKAELDKLRLDKIDGKLSPVPAGSLPAFVEPASPPVAGASVVPPTAEVAQTFGALSENKEDRQVAAPQNNFEPETFHKKVAKKTVIPPPRTIYSSKCVFRRHIPEIQIKEDYTLKEIDEQTRDEEPEEN